MPLQVINRSVAIFAEALCNKLHEIKEIALAPCSNIRFLFNDRAPEQGGIRDRWEGIIHRLETTDMEELRGYMANSPELRFKRPDDPSAKPDLTNSDSPHRGFSAPLLFLSLGFQLRFVLL